MNMQDITSILVNDRLTIIVIIIEFLIFAHILIDCD